ncbi:S41 family peptidase [Flavobacterium chungbukense]|uniref:Tail specific protease domain-containing protein n=1 Tax=Flavobacterium chungbukense TaxID=877464 RepID=A0ABP7YRW8_9FLAO|nr:S41 family peptidase [Flavobacterium chungbukense]MCC4923342.1 peptidase S41 [Flavobacterium chungbukense]
MKTILKSALFLFLFAFSLQSCEDNDDVAAPADVQINSFIWKGLNEVYLWQADVPNLADNRFATENDFNNFLKGYAKPEDLFEDLLNKPESKYPNGDAIDRFSWIVDDYTVLEQELSGISKNNGVDFRLSRVASGSNDLVGYVRYIIPNSDASTKAIKRGDLFTSINGTKLTVSNYQELIGKDSYTLNLADYNGSAFVSNGKSVTLTKTVLEENPIFINKVITSGSHKIGYLMYNGFYSEYDDRLNQAFGTLKGQGVTDFILDLRYNGGGSIATSAKLASMITGQFDTQIFSKMTFNSKQMQGLSTADLEDLNVRFVKNLNSLNMTTVYVITTASTASASELIINGLKPYINVVQIGETTVGKNVGSFTVYDSETLTTKKGINPNHKYAMQPLVLKITNSANFGDYTQGLVPTYQQYESVLNYGVLGETTEPLLSNAISKITGNAAKKIQTDSEPLRPYVTDSKILNGLRHGMYLKTAPKAF